MFWPASLRPMANFFGKSLPASSRAKFPCYDYHPLAEGSREIRLIELLSSDRSWRWSDAGTPEIVLSILHVDIASLHAGKLHSLPLPPGRRSKTESRDTNTYQGTDSLPKFAALSYVWGPKAPSRRVYVVECDTSASGDWNGSYITIRENLYQFLWYYRDTDAHCTTEHLWVDQLSINQSDVHERNHQVRLMAQVYESASFVIAWLGSSPEIKQAAATLRSARNNCCSRTEAHIATVVLLNNNFFTRLWIVQEILLAREVRILCGKQWLTLWDLKQAWVPRNRIFFQTGTLPSTVSNCAPFLLWDANRTALLGVPAASGWTPQERTLASCIVHYSKNECENPRDRLYALFGLANEADLVNVDYTKYVSLVYYDGVQMLYNEYYRRVDYFETENQSAGYIGAALTLAANMGMPRSLWNTLNDLEYNKGWIYQLAALLPEWT